MDRPVDRTPRPAPSGAIVQLDAAGRATLQAMIRDVAAPALRAGAGRPPTREETAVAVWANLAVDVPGLRLEDVRRLLDGRP